MRRRKARYGAVENTTKTVVTPRKQTNKLYSLKWIATRGKQISARSGMPLLIAHKPANLLNLPVGT